MAESKRARPGRDPDAARAHAGEAGTGPVTPGTYEPAELVTLRHHLRETVLAHQRSLRELALELSSAEERERQRVSAVLHDQVTQDIAAARLRTGLLRDSARSQERAESLAEVEKLLMRAMSGANSLTLELYPPALYEQGLEAALEWLVGRFNEKTQTSFAFAAEGPPVLLPDEARAFLFQAVRELLTNVLNHARADGATVVARTRRREVAITVDDDGVGFDPGRSGRPAGNASQFGLFSIRQRLGHLGGRLEIEAQPGQGSRLTLIVPL
ncbi:MAG: sensor histidine kinase [Phycisphaerae bacterium]